MSYLPLYQTILGLELGSHSETYVQIPEIPAGARLNFLIRPSAAYYALVIHRFSFGNVFPNVFRVWMSQKGVTYHTGILTTDILRDGVATWLYVTAADPLTFSLANEDIAPNYFESCIWQIDVPSITMLENMKKAVKAYSGVPGLIRDVAFKPAVVTLR